nr:MAG TPA: hypothetical protein [Caudoviricetes sp.]
MISKKLNYSPQASCTSRVTVINLAIFLLLF